MQFRKEGLVWVLPPLALAIWWHGISLPTHYNPWIYFLVVTCPCTIGIGLLAFFFRDPVREIPHNFNPKMHLLSPADGKLIAIEQEGDRTAFYIEMHLNHVHVNRSPVNGKVISVKRIQGKHYLVHFFKQTKANQSKAVKKNAHAIITIEDQDHHHFTCFLICGAFFRRARPFVKVGDFLTAGDRMGMILFGSTVKVSFNNTLYTFHSKIGDKVRAGETILARKNTSDLNRS